MRSGVRGYVVMAGAIAPFRGRILMGKTNYLQAARSDSTAGPYYVPDWDIGEIIRSPRRHGRSNGSGIVMPSDLAPRD